MLNKAFELGNLHEGQKRRSGFICKQIPMMEEDVVRHKKMLTEKAEKI